MTESSRSQKATLACYLRAVRDVAQARRTRRIIAGQFIFVVVFGLLAFFAAPPLIRHIAEQQLSRQLDRPVKLGHIALNPYTLRLEADRIRIGERSGTGDFVDISRLIVQLSWTSLLRAAPIINEVQLDSPNVHIVRYDAQRFNFTDLIEKFVGQPSKPNSKPALFSVSNIRLENGQITFDDRLLGVTHVIDKWKLSIPFIATLPSKTDIFVEPLLRARIDGSALAIDGKAKPFAASRESEVSLRFDGLDLPKMLSYAPQKLPVTVQAGKLSTDLKLNFSMSGNAPSLRVTGTIDLNDVDVRDEKKAPLFAAHALHVTAATLEPLKSLYHFDDIRLDAPTVNLARNSEGMLSGGRMFAPESAAEKGAARVPEATSVPAGEEKYAAPLDLSISQLALSDGTVNIVDEAAPRPVTLRLESISVTLADFSTFARVPARYTLNTTFKDTTGSLGVTGAFSFATKSADAKIDLKSASLSMLQPYLDSMTGAQVIDGALSATVNVRVDWAKSRPDVQIGESQLSLQSLKVAARGSKEPLVALAQGQVGIKQVDVSGRNAEITRVDATGLVVNARRLKDGSIDLATLAGVHQTEQRRTAIHAVKKGQNQVAPWHYKIGDLSLRDATANFTDNTTLQPVKLSITALQLKVKQISDDLSRPLPIDLQAMLNRKGTLGVSGDVTVTPFKLTLKVNASRLDAAAFEPYFGDKLNARIASALLNASGDLAVTGANALRAAYKGDVALVEVRMLDKTTSVPFARWGSLALTNLKANYGELGTDVDAERVTFTKFYGRVLLSPQGRLNLTDVIAHESGASRSKSLIEPVPLMPGTPAAESGGAAVSASAPPRVTRPQNPMRLHFGQLVLEQGRITYTDNFIKPHFTANLVGIQGTVGAFGTRSTIPAPVDVNAKLAANGPLSIRGTVNPLIVRPALDLTASAQDIELTNLTPYSAKYAGYPITKGKLNVDLRYKLDNDLLSANNHLYIDQLTLGDHVGTDTATKLPVKFAISLLKNSRGEIDVNIPVSGSLSNPEFSVGGLIWRAVLNQLEKAATAPFSLLANAFGGSGEEMGHVDFDPGSAKLSDVAGKKLDTIAEALSDKETIRIDLIGRVDPDLDEPALRSAYVDRQVRRQKIKGVVGNGESVDLSTVTVDQNDYDKYLSRVYKDADFKKPRNLVGLTRSLPVDEMKSALAEHAPIDDTSLRELAQQRAQSVQQYVEGKIDSSRVFVVAPKLDAQGIEGTGATTRVDFSLK